MGSRPGAGPPGLRPPVVLVRTGPDDAAVIVTGESGKIGFWGVIAPGSAGLGPLGGES